MRKKRENTTCRHYSGSYHNTHCTAGIEYRSVTPFPDENGKALRLPCFTKCLFENPSPAQAAEFARRGSCEKFDLMTQEEFERHEADVESAIQASIARMQKCGPMILRIKQENKGRSNSGTEPCPVCGTDLHWRISGYNGHVHMQCSTENCIAFME